MVDMSKPGDIVRPERWGTFEPLGDTPLQSITYDGKRKSANGVELDYVTVELQQPPKDKVAVGDVLIMRKFLPERIAIRNSRFHDTRARGLLIMGSNGVIENNTIERTAMSGIYLLSEIPGFGGSDWVSNLIVRNNVIRDTCFNDTGALGTAAALLLCNRPAELPGEKSRFYPWVAAHRNISIVGNTIDGCDNAGMLINGLDGGELRDNVVKNSNQRKGTLTWNGLTIPFPYAITLMNSKNVKVEGNAVSNMGSCAKGDVGDLGIYPAVETGK